MNTINLRWKLAGWICPEIRKELRGLSDQLELHSAVVLQPFQRVAVPSIVQGEGTSSYGGGESWGSDQDGDESRYWWEKELEDNSFLAVVVVAILISLLVVGIFMSIWRWRQG